MRILLPLLFALAATACGTIPESPQALDERFHAHTLRVLDEMWAEFPEFAIRNGNYRYADRLSIPDAARRERTRAFYERQLAALSKFDPAALSASNRIELAIMRNRFERPLWELSTFRSWQWQP